MAWMKTYISTHPVDPRIVYTRRALTCVSLGPGPLAVFVSLPFPTTLINHSVFQSASVDESTWLFCVVRLRGVALLPPPLPRCRCDWVSGVL